MDVETTGMERLLERDQRIVIGGLVMVIAVSWLYIVAGAGMKMGGGAAMLGGDFTAARSAWTPAYVGLMLVMWWVMMVAMMLPSAAPMVLLFTTVNRTSHMQGRPYVPTGMFAAGYLVAWGGFSVVAVLLQRELERFMVLSPMMRTTSPYLGAALLIAAGVYQVTPLKHSCLRHCRSPMQFIAHHWRPGKTGAFRMGLEHGSVCLGCCGLLMTLLFYGGVMNLWWIAGLAIYVLIEKLAPTGQRFGRYAGGLLILWGGWLLVAAVGLSVSV